MGCRKSVKFSFRIRELHRPFWRLSFFFEVKLVNLGLKGDTQRGCFLPWNSYFLGERWRGNSTRGRSFRAKKPGTKMSIRASMGLPALIAWPASWNMFDRGSKSSIKCTARNYLSSFINISYLSNLLRPWTLTKLSLGAVCLLSAKTSEEEIMVRPTKLVKLKGLNPMLRDLILGYPTWFSLLSWAVKTVVPLPRCDQVIILYALIRLRKTWYHSNNVGSGFEVKSCTSKGMALVHVNNIVPCEP